MKWSGTEFMEDAEWADREILQLRDKTKTQHEELCELRVRLHQAHCDLSESLTLNDRQEALIVELRDGLARLLDKIREAKQ
jgi:hypothetical protein